MSARDEWLTVREAQDWLDVGEHMMRKLLRLGAEGKPNGLPWQPDPLDGRAKRVRASDVERLLDESPLKSAV